MHRAFPLSHQLLAKAVSEGTPAFIGNNVPASSPSRGAPYIVDSQTLVATFGTNAARRSLIGRLQSARTQLSQICEVRAVLIGGSLVRIGVTAPRDCDAVIFYAMRSDRNADEVASAMGEVVGNSRKEGLDLRLVPVDVDPIDLIKAACYFSLLFASERGGVLPKHGSLLLVDIPELA